MDLSTPGGAPAIMAPLGLSNLGGGKGGLAPGGGKEGGGKGGHCCMSRRGVGGPSWLEKAGGGGAS